MKGKVELIISDLGVVEAVFSGLVDAIDIQAMVYALRQSYALDYLTKRREEELNNVEVTAKQLQEKAFIDRKLKEELEAQDKKIKEEQEVEIVLQEIAALDKIKIENAALEAERIAKRGIKN